MQVASPVQIPHHMDRRDANHLMSNPGAGAACAVWGVAFREALEALHLVARILYRLRHI